MSNLILPPGYSMAGNYSRPEQNPEIEAKVRSWLREYDPLLDIRWFDGIVDNERHNSREGRYALICTWPQSDPRYEMIKNGEIGNTPYDILGWFAEDMQNGGSAAIAPDMMERKVIELLASADNQRIPWRERLKKAFEKNVELKRKKRHDFIEGQVHDLASHHRNEGLGIHQVNVPVEVK